jgi:hypothetical protein
VIESKGMPYPIAKFSKLHSLFRQSCITTDETSATLKIIMICIFLLVLRESFSGPRSGPACAQYSLY